MLPGEMIFLPSFLLSDASYFVLDDSWKPHSLIEFSAISHDSIGGREQPVQASSGGVLDEWGKTWKIRLERSCFLKNKIK